ncbi:cytochrome b/b6 domain-containing protein [Paraburkholderia sp. BL9I2N2]|uniref:cytochrome b n=1 Tax=Paraburkholderia sp. BL9I2N2 TaxID=1938809 RepID=UPI0010531F32|nr:cytochrome b/b6 domain-containing protein [Paraburkholderia sp. BL9I2N2]
MAARDDHARYGSFAIALHWITAALLLVQFVLAHSWGVAPKPTRHLMIATHMSFGIALTAVLVMRKLNRLDSSIAADIGALSSRATRVAAPSIIVYKIFAKREQLF